MSQAELARRVGIKQPTISDLIAGKSRSSSHLHKIARELQTTPEYLLGETDVAAPIVGEHRNDFKHAEMQPSDQLEVRMLDLAYGMGGTYVDDNAVEVRTEQFPRSFVRSYTGAPADALFFAQGIGDSMMPTLLDSDLLLIDTSRDTVNMDDKIWAIAIGEVGSIKRLRQLASGGLEIISDNPNVPNQMAGDEEIHVIGQMVAAVRKF